MYLTPRRSPTSTSLADGCTAILSLQGLLRPNHDTTQRNLWPLPLRLPLRNSKGLLIIIQPSIYQAPRRITTRMSCTQARPCGTQERSCACTVRKTLLQCRRDVEQPQTRVRADTQGPHPKKLARFQKVEFMKMRHRAPADPRDKPGSIGIDQRLHVRVNCDSDPEAAQKIFWFRKVSRLALRSSLSGPLSSLQLRLWAPGERSICSLVISMFRRLW